MANAPIPLIAGNWKMNTFHNDGHQLANDVAERMMNRMGPPVDVAVCPPITIAGSLCAFLAPTPIKVGAQDCSQLANGAHTGDVSAEQIANLGCACVIVGHSERRRDHHETNELVRAKAEAVHRTRMTAIICIGETQEERDAGKTIEVVTKQLEESVPESCHSGNTVIAYEPVWAIGTGRTPTSAEIAEVHQQIRDLLFERFDYDGFAIRILYGGSVNEKNAHDILRVPHVNGALVGGASLKSDTFWSIIEAVPKPSEVSAPVRVKA
ncbi:MAG: triose-phosphate isomerase [Alphaproteobacteria bacterium]|nr:triose-phosphate isomerase [Alphaproteobacteria bacterium]